ncbi:ParM/StbA family protein [Sulfitobacter sp. R18_1]|uniref:ParM/StbA family protein n=1 Tax=Sulfitobacter sp. R18_1 TaxID=2821104 RepID=UPI001AD9E4BD|nr:ParM/StbA family protein [Sulfitobacter sp. R18_1]MBO9428662.1 ParM/StbA family protein [Sulfitobacter sp. R18_1]
MTKKDKNSNIIPVAVDDGYAQTKLVGECPETGEIKKAIMRSTVRAGRVGLGNFSGGGISLYATEEGDHFTVSDEIESENTQFDGFHTSQLNRVLVNHALMESGYSGRNVSLVTGLPVGDYFLDDERDHEHIEAKRVNLLKSVSSANGDPMPILSDVRVGCQAVAAWFDYVLDENLKKRNDASGRIAIVDIGGRTTDIAVVLGGHAIDHSVSGTANHGVLDVYNAMSKAIRKEFRVRDQFPLDQVDQAVRTGKFKIWNQEHDVSHIVDEVVRDQEGRIAREVHRRVGSAANLSAVVFVGGGSALFKSVANHFPNGHVAEDPEFSNAMGLYKYIKVKG